MTLLANIALIGSRVLGLLISLAITASMADHTYTRNETLQKLLQKQVITLCAVFVLSILLLLMV